MTQSIRTPDDLWSAPTTDWFQTGDSIGVGASGPVALPHRSPGMDGSGSVAITTTCSNPTGCDLQATAPSDTVAMWTPAGPQSIPRIPASTPSAWAPGAPLGMGVTVLGSTSGKSVGTWGSGVDFSDLSLLNFVGLRRSSTLLQHQGSSGIETTSVGVRMNAPPGTPTGPYSGTFTLVAVPSP